MATITLPFSFTSGTTISSSQVNSNFTTIYNDYNGNITDANIASAAAIANTKLLNVLGNTYTPTGANITNTTGVYGTVVGFYLRIGAFAVVWAGGNVTASVVNTDTEFTLTLPVTTTLGSTIIGGGASGELAQYPAIRVTNSGNLALCSFRSISVNSEVWSVIFGYQIG